MIDGIRGVSTNPAKNPAKAPEPKPDRIASRALVVTPVAASERPQVTVRHPAAFLAHLLAARDQAPHLRQMRRAEPETAIATYAAATQQHLPAGRFVSKQV